MYFTCYFLVQKTAAARIGGSNYSSDNVLRTERRNFFWHCFGFAVVEQKM